MAGLSWARSGVRTPALWVVSASSGSFLHCVRSAGEAADPSGVAMARLEAGELLAGVAYGTGRKIPTGLPGML